MPVLTRSSTRKTTRTTQINDTSENDIPKKQYPSSTKTAAIDETRPPSRHSRKRRANTPHTLPTESAPEAMKTTVSSTAWSKKRGRRPGSRKTEQKPNPVSTSHSTPRNTQPATVDPSDHPETTKSNTLSNPKSNRDGRAVLGTRTRRPESAPADAEHDKDLRFRQLAVEAVATPQKRHVDVSRSYVSRLGVAATSNQDDRLSPSPNTKPMILSPNPYKNFARNSQASFVVLDGADCPGTEQDWQPTGEEFPFEDLQRLRCFIGDPEFTPFVQLEKTHPNGFETEYNPEFAPLLALPGDLEVLVELQKSLDNCLRIRRQRNIPLLFWNGGDGLEMHVRKSALVPFDLEALRRMLWIAPRLYRLSWRHSEHKNTLKHPFMDLEILAAHLDCDSALLRPLRPDEQVARAAHFRDRLACLAYRALTELLALGEPPARPPQADKLCSWDGRLRLRTDSIPQVALPPVPPAFQSSRRPATAEAVMGGASNVLSGIRAAIHIDTHHDRLRPPAGATLAEISSPFPSTPPPHKRTALMSPQPAGAYATVPALDFASRVEKTLSGQEVLSLSTTSPSYQSTPHFKRLSMAPTDSLPQTPTKSPLLQGRHASATPSPASVRSGLSAGRHRSLSAGRLRSKSPFKSPLGTPGKELTPQQKKLLDRVRLKETQQNIEAMAINEIADIDASVRRHEDSIRIYERLLPIFNRMRGLPMMPVTTLVSKLSAVLPDIPKQRIEPALRLVLEYCPNLLCLRKSMVNANQEIVQYHLKADLQCARSVLQSKLEDCQKESQCLRTKLYEKYTRKAYSEMAGIVDKDADIDLREIYRNLPLGLEIASDEGTRAVESNDDEDF